MVNDLRQPALAGPLVEVNEVGCDADGPFLVQRQCDEFGSVLAVCSSAIDSAGTAGPPEAIDDQVQVLRVAIDLGVVQRRPAGTVEVYWLAPFHTQAL